jgi:predicted dehydrogenase
MALGDVDKIAAHPSVTIVAACDVDEKRTVEFRKKHPEARIYSDFRELLEKERDLQSVNVSTPDHMHAPIAMSAMNRGLHVYGQKPLTHDLYECRRLTEAAREKKLVTQMGIQIHSQPAYRTAVHLVQSGAIGKVREVHTWSNKSWGDKAAMPAAGDPIPEGFNWNLWLGVCADRPFVGNGWYHPGSWRRRLDFGTGTFGDMGCHIYDPVFQALALTAPVSLRSEGPAPNEHSWATDAVIHYTFPGTQFTADKLVRVTWYDGTQRPPAAIQEQVLARDETDEKKRKLPDQGSIFLGTEGIMVLPHIARPRLVGDKFKDFAIEEVKGPDHYSQFIDAVRGQLGEDGKPVKASANFDYSGPLTEAVLLGSVATRFRKQDLAWDAPGLKFTNVAEANQFVKRTYRAGFEVRGLSM